MPVERINEAFDLVHAEKSIRTVVTFPAGGQLVNSGMISLANISSVSGIGKLMKK